MSKAKTLTAIAGKHGRQTTYFFRINSLIYSAKQLTWRGLSLEIVGTVKLPARGIGPAWYARNVPNNVLKRKELRHLGVLAQVEKKY
ncbi:MAG: hypothetical protein WD492_06965 [Alkalispirochaeta sp.]